MYFPIITIGQNKTTILLASTKACRKSMKKKLTIKYHINHMKENLFRKSLKHDLESNEQGT